MEILPILLTLRRNRIGALLISLQIALTLAIVCNSLSIIQSYATHMRTSSGVDEGNILAVDNSWVGEPTDLKARIAADLAALRSLPGVVDAEATNGFPLGGHGWGTGISLKPDQGQPTASAAEYFVDEHGLATYGLRLVAGRWFTPREVGDMRVGQDQSPAPSAVVTRRLGRALFPAGNALGQAVYLNGATPTRVVGIIDRAQAPWAGVSWGESSVENSVFLPYRFQNGQLDYVIRTRPGRLAAVMRAVRDRLYGLTRQRVILGVSTFGEVRLQTYQTERSLSVTLGVLCALLMTVTGCGIIGLTLYWVAQRRRQIGMRRALGARRVDILRYFHTENLLIAGTGAALGIVVGLAGNTWLASALALTRMSVGYIGAGAVIVLALSQAAVLWPALRAASIPPAAAIRDL